MKLLKSFLLITLLLSCFSLSSKEKSWEIYHEDADVRISFQYQDCEFAEQFDYQVVILKIDNLSNKLLLIKWATHLWYDNSCINCEYDTPESIKSVSIPAKKSIKGECGKVNELQFFSKFTDKIENMPGIDKIEELTKFELKDLKIIYE